MPRPGSPRQRLLPKTAGVGWINLIWIDLLPLRAGQQLTVLLTEMEPNSHHGKTIDDRCADEPATPITDFKPSQ